MEPQSLYLKYRPFQLDDVVGQKSITTTLTKASETEDFSHAYLFSGNHGCGKTSTARIVATLLNCENVKGGVTCGSCRACKGIRNGTTMDVRELDGATNRSIDDIRNLIDGAQWSPTELKKKVYIIDECHQLTKDATSALLKILEEPPSYLNFILCTTEIKKIMPTILSRCQRFNFGKISSSDIGGRLFYIAKTENINITEDAIEVIAKMARGSLRDGVSYLDQIKTVANGKSATAENVRKYFGVTSSAGVLNMIKAIKACNVALILDQVNDLVMASADASQIMFEISETFRNIMVLKAQKGKSALIDLPESEVEELNKIGENMNLSQLLKLAHMFSDIDKKLSFNINERWIMEATLIKCAVALRK